ncbi:heterokaryon incompatibility protein-domain-containing protein [Hypoxylon argillaceum]|nr:heterokaryon incompatibility protein-domain-containing protein [Hypoxylon argillaceum]
MSLPDYEFFRHDISRLVKRKSNRSALAPSTAITPETPIYLPDKMSTPQDSNSCLPDIPRQVKVKSDRITFRESGNASAESRIKSLSSDIEALQKKQITLMQKETEMKGACQKTLDEMNKRHKESFSQSSGSFDGRDINRKFSLTECKAQFQKTEKALMKFITPDTESEVQRKIKISERDKLEGDLTTVIDRREIEERRIRMFTNDLALREARLKKLEERQRRSKGGVIPKEVTSEIGNKPRDYKGKEKGAFKSDDIVRRQERDDRTKGSGMDEKHKELVEKDGRGDLLQRRPNISLPTTERKKPDQEMLERKIRNVKREIDSIKEKKSKGEEREIQLQGNVESLKGEINGLNQEIGGNEGHIGDSNEEQARQNEDDANEEQQRVLEYDEQEERRTNIQSLRDSLLSAKPRGFGRHTADSHENDSEGQVRELHEEDSEGEIQERAAVLENDNEGEIREQETILEDARALEDQISKLHRLRDKSNQVQDLRTILERELKIEREWSAKVKKASETSLRTIEAPKDGEVHGKNHVTSKILQNSKVYRPLKDKEMRLLLLMPAPKGCRHYPLICALMINPPHGNGRKEYAALSYHWGTESDDQVLYLFHDGLIPGKLDRDRWGSVAKRAIRVPIRNNLFRALLRLRKEDNQVALWVDYLCINQGNATEKTAQLRNMSHVYRQATNVCIWLGEADAQNNSDDAMDFIPTIMDFAVLDRHARDENKAKKWYALAELMRDRWFSRRWVVQEIALAQSATVHCGEKMVHWLDFADAVSLLVSNQETIRNLFDFSNWREGPNTLGEVNSFGANILLEATSKLFLRTAKGGIRRPITNIESLVTSLKTFDTSDQRDLIYSLVSIASDTSQYSRIYSSKSRRGGAQQEFEVDYNKPEIEVYKDFTKFCIESSRSLNIICRPWAMPVRASGGRPGKQVRIPSWIPLLSTSEFGAPADVYSGRKNGENLVGPVGDPRYTASADRPYKLVDRPYALEKDYGLYDDEKSLFVKGFTLATIGEVSPRCTGGVIVQESLMMGFGKGSRRYGDSVPDKIWRTLVADRGPDGKIPPAWYQRACLRCLEIADTFNNGDLNIGELLQGNSDMLKKYLIRVRNVTWNRRFFTATRQKDHLTKTGNSRDTNILKKYSRARKAEFLQDVSESDETDSLDDIEFYEREYSEREYSERESGEDESDEDEPGKEIVKKEMDKMIDDDDEFFGLGPPHMEKGDIICILFGCSVPVVLRRISAMRREVRHQLVGEVYVHGQMDGEAVNDFDEGLFKEEIFELE